MKDELGWKIMETFVGLRAETYNYLIDKGSEDKKAKRTKKCIIRAKRKFENDQNCLKATQLLDKINHLEKNQTGIDSIKKIIKNW